MSYSFKIRGAAAAETDIAASKAVLSFKTLACDELKIVSKNAALAALGDSAEVFENGTRIFFGTCFSKTDTESAEAKECAYVFKSPWFDLERIPFMQGWKGYDASSANPEQSVFRKTKALLGEDEDGAKISISEQIAEILNYAKSMSANLDFSAAGFSSQMPSDEMRDMTCDEALKRVLKWAPDAVSHFDYSQNPPLLKIEKRSSLGSADLSQCKLKSLKYSERPDLRPESVCVVYEKTNSHNGAASETFSKDLYPPNAVEGAKGSIAISVKLGGYSSCAQNQKIETANIDLSSAAWWRSKVPFLNDPRLTSFTIRNARRNSSLPRELVSGSVREWMLKSLERDEAKCEVEYEMQNSRKGVKSFSVKLLATDASTMTYSRNVYTTKEEAQPAGLARAIYEAASVAQVEGEAEILSPAPAGIFCKNAELEDKFENATVSALSLNLKSGFALAKFGPPAHLYPADIAQMYRASRGRKISVSNARKEAKSPGTVEIPGDESFCAERVAQIYESWEKLTIAPEGSGNSNSVNIDISDIDPNDPDVEIKLRKVVVAENGQAKYAYVLMSEPF